MKIKNIHQRNISAPANLVGSLMDTAASSNDRIWPYENWSKIKFDKPLQVGASGGHGPIKYEIISYTPGESIKFRFLKDLEGNHELSISEVESNICVLQHSIYADVKGSMILLWSLVIRPLHNALIEDLLDKVELQVSQVKQQHTWGVWVKFLRKMRGTHTEKKPFNL